jgi:UV DNA damage endonuclease
LRYGDLLLLWFLKNYNGNINGIWNMNEGKIGFCCKWMSPTGDKDAEMLMNHKSTTIACLSRLNDSKIISKLLDLVHHNLDVTKNLVGWVAQLPPNRRILRLGSELLPGYTHEVANWAYQEPVIRKVMETKFAEIGDIARVSGVRLSFHPGQYCVLNSMSEITQIRAVEELEYHVEMMRLMGFTGGWHPHGASVNIHVGSKAGGVQRLLSGFESLSEDAQNLLTIENDEICYGLSDVEPLAEHIALVLDIHHEWVFSGGTYIQPDDKRIQYVKDSWRGIRPLGHYSVTSEDVLVGHAEDKLPDFATMRGSGMSLRDIRAHSDGCWNQAANDWALSHSSWMDIEVEAKFKNLASNQLVNRGIQTGIIKN